MNFILASGSPRRKELMEMLGVKPGSAPDGGVSPSGTPATGKGNTPAGGEQRRSSQDTMRKDAR